MRILAEGIARQSKKEKQRKLHEKLLSRENGGVSQGTSTEDGQGQESGGQGSSGAQQPFVRRPDLSELEWQRSWFGPRIGESC